MAFGYFASNCKGDKCKKCKRCKKSDGGDPERSSESGASQGVKFPSDDGSRNERISRIADAIEVNNMLIDNRLSEGDVTSCLKFKGDRETETDIDIYHKQLRLLSHTILLLRSIPSLLSSIARSQTSSFANRDGDIYLKPRKPEEIYLAWACVLVANVFPE